jgi:hypothetical protein
MQKLALVAFSFAAVTAFSGAALAVQDTPSDINGVETVCTGVGSAKDDPRWNAYPVKLVFANTVGEDVATEHVTLTKGGHAVMATECDAPWLLIKAPAGRYGVTATVDGQSGTRIARAKFSTSGSGAQKTVTLAFPSLRQPAAR